jgi:hypothetical protein
MIASESDYYLGDVLPPSVFELAQFMQSNMKEQWQFVTER